MKLEVKMNCQLSIHVVTLSLMIALVVDCTANAQNPAAWQYGHSSRWQSAREWGDSEKFLEPNSIEIGQGRAQIISDGDLLFIA